MAQDARDGLIQKARRLIVKMIANDTDKALLSMTEEDLKRYVSELEKVAGADKAADDSSADHDAGQKAASASAPSASSPKEQRW
ncbi:MAG: hypothetical protein AAF220_10025 [Pseudomonadota bacterium]